MVPNISKTHPAHALKFFLENFTRFRNVMATQGTEVVCSDNSFANDGDACNPGNHTGTKKLNVSAQDAMTLMRKGHVYPINQAGVF